MPPQIVGYENFDGLLNVAAVPERAADNELAVCVNMELDSSKTYLVTRLGTAFINKTSAAIDTMYEYMPKSSPNTPWLVVHIPNVGIFAGTNGGATLTNITGSSTAAASNYPFEFKAMNDTIIGVSRGQYPIKWNAADSAVSALNGTVPPQGLHIEIWNARCWISDGTNPNRLYFSKVGDSTDWTTAGVSGAGYIEVGYDDGDVITGLVAHRERLFIFKKRHIYQIITANPNTDNSLWRLELFTKEGGCLSARSIQVMDNEVLFISQPGVVSLSTIMEWGDFSKAVISNKSGIATALYQDESVYSSAIFRTKNQYWLAIYGTVYVATKNNRGEWVWTYYQFYNGISSATTATNGVYVPISVGAMAATNYYSPHVTISANNLYYSDGTYGMYSYPSAQVTADQSNHSLTYASYRDDYGGPAGDVPIQVQVATKLFSLNARAVKKKFYSWAVTLQNQVFSVTSNYDASGGTVKVRVLYDSFSSSTLSLTPYIYLKMEPTGSDQRWGFTKTFWNRCSKIRNADLIQLYITHDLSGSLDQFVPFSLKGVAIKAVLLNERRAYV